jgi:hypothetical protein
MTVRSASMMFLTRATDPAKDWKTNRNWGSAAEHGRLVVERHRGVRRISRTLPDYLKVGYELSREHIHVGQLIPWYIPA